MQVILLENIMKLGKIGDQVEVKNGFARNYLLKQGKALRTSKENIELVSQKKVELNIINKNLKGINLKILLMIMFFNLFVLATDFSNIYTPEEIFSLFPLNINL